MRTKDGYSSDQTLPSFLLEQTGKSGIGKASNLAVFPSRVLGATILVTSALVLGVATLSVGHPIALLADLTASFGDKSAVQPSTDQSASTIRVSADAQVTNTPATSSITKNQAGGEIAAAEATGEDQPRAIDAPTDALFRQFQAWAAEQDAQPIEPAQPVQDDAVQPVKEAASQPAQDDPPAKTAEEGRTPLRLPTKHRHTPASRNARAEMPKETPRNGVHRPQRERVAPPRAAMARDQVVQNAEPRSYLPGFFGSRD